MNELMLTVAVASFLGSLHCVGMCGGFVAFYASNDRWDHRAGVDPHAALWGAHAAYNLGRLAAYLGLGAAAGALGAALNLAGNAAGISRLAAVVCGGLIVLWGATMLATAAGYRPAQLALPSWLNAGLGRVLVRLRQAPAAVRAGVLGVSSALLPCGWLYAFAGTAAGTGSPDLGAAVMFAFWMGTVPAMLSLGLGVHRLGRWVGPRLGVLMPATLIVIGILTVVQRGFEGEGVFAFGGGS